MSKDGQSSRHHAYPSRRYPPKVRHVLSAPNDDKGHHCHWPGCTAQVKPAMWGCSKHWYMLPKAIRDAIFRAYVPGQENRKDPSETYIKAAQAAQLWIQEHHDNDRPQPKLF